MLQKNYTSSAGTKAFKVSATVASTSSINPVSYIKSVSYNVGANICLLYDPSRSVKKGAAYPIKLQACDVAGKNISSSSIVLQAVSPPIKIDNSVDGPNLDSGNANPDSNFRFDSTLGIGGGYIFNLKTSNLSAGTWKLFFTITGDLATTKRFTLFNVK